MLFIGRLVKFVREVDRIILLANATQMPLLLIGSWPDEAYLKSLAGPTVVFLWQINDPATKKDILRHARGLINIAKESAWLATMEALSCGVPVLGYAGWATPELVWKDGGVLVSAKDPQTLLTWRERFQAKQRNRKDIQESFRARYEQTRVEWK
jgi:glycosyltransferase involved in cell wall biosynthesis